jgi:hypothetical protein
MKSVCGLRISPHSVEKFIPDRDRSVEELIERNLLLAAARGVRGFVLRIYKLGIHKIVHLVTVTALQWLGR